MNNDQLKKQIAVIVEKQIKIANYCMDESLFPGSFQTEIRNCFDVLLKKVNELVDDFELELEFEDIEKWLSENDMNWKEEEKLLDRINSDVVREYYDVKLKDRENIVIVCDNLLQREKIKEFLETEIFTDCHRYNAAVENL